MGAKSPRACSIAVHFVRVDGTTLAYRSWGTHGSPVVLLGGAAEPSWVWHDVGPLLARGGHRVFALDLPPFGYSQRRGPYTMSHWLQLVRGFEQRLRIERPVLVGHSLGAGVAAAAGLAHPHRVAGVVLLDGDALAFGGNHAWLSDLLVYPYYTAAYRLITAPTGSSSAPSGTPGARSRRRRATQRLLSSNARSAWREPTPRAQATLRGRSSPA